jgi:hypothetical protein
MTTEKTLSETPQPKKISNSFNRIAYVSFVGLSLYFFLFSDDFMTGVSNLGIALVFDPFDQQTPWKQRPLYQRAWLMVHVSIVLTLFAVGIF